VTLGFALARLPSLAAPFYRQSEITPPQHGNGPSVRILLGRTPIERRALERRLRLRIEQLHKELLKSPKGSFKARRGARERTL
jgi:hypothetical protein